MKNSRTNSAAKQSRSLSVMAGSKIGRIEQTNSLIERKIVNLQNKLVSVESEIKRLNESHSAYRKETLSRIKTREENRAAELDYEQKRVFQRKVNLNQPSQLKNQVKLIERNKLTLTNRINQFIMLNQSLKQKIDILRKNKMMYDQVNFKLDVQLEKVAKQLHEMQSKSEHVQDQLHQNYINLNKQKKNNLHSQRNNLKQLESIFLEVRRENFMDRKSQMEKVGSAIPDYTQAKTLQTLQIPPDSPTRRESPRRRTKVRQTLTNYSLEQMQEMVRKYDQQYKKILDSMKSKDLKEAADNFVENEAENYAIYNFVNELIKEVRELEQVKAQRQEQLKLNELQFKIPEVRQKQNNANKQTLDSKKKAVEVLQSKLKHDREIYKGIKMAIPGVFQKLGLDFKKFCEKQIDSDITQSNINQFFQKIQEQANLIAKKSNINASLASSRKEKAPAFTPPIIQLNSTLDKLGEQFQMTRTNGLKKEENKQEGFLDREELLRQATQLKNSSGSKRKAVKRS